MAERQIPSFEDMKAMNTRGSEGDYADSIYGESLKEDLSDKTDEERAELRKRRAEGVAYEEHLQKMAQRGEEGVEDYSDALERNWKEPGQQTDESEPIPGTYEAKVAKEQAEYQQKLSKYEAELASNAKLRRLEEMAMDIERERLNMGENPASEKLTQLQDREQKLLSLIEEYENSPDYDHEIMEIMNRQVSEGVEQMREIKEGLTGDSDEAENQPSAPVSEPSAPVSPTVPSPQPEPTPENQPPATPENDEPAPAETQEDETVEERFARIEKELDELRERAEAAEARVKELEAESQAKDNTIYDLNETIKGLESLNATPLDDEPEPATSQAGATTVGRAESNNGRHEVGGPWHNLFKGNWRQAWEKRPASWRRRSKKLSRTATRTTVNVPATSYDDLMDNANDGTQVYRARP